METKILICIIGGSGSGKSTLEDDMIIRDGFSRAISTTTRKRRDGEHNGRDYHFVSVPFFEELKKEDKLIEFVMFDNNYYGLTKSEFHKNKDNLVIVVEPNGFVQISKFVEQNNLSIASLVVFMDIPEKERFKNMIKRGDNPIAIQERLKKEKIVEDFKKFNITPDITVTKLSPSTSEIVLDDIYKAIQVFETK